MNNCKEAWPRKSHSYIVRDHRRLVLSMLEPLVLTLHLLEHGLEININKNGDVLFSELTYGHPYI